MTRRSDDRIRELCAKILSSHDDEEVVNLCAELRRAIQDHVKHARSRAADYPVTRERRKSLGKDRLC